MYKQGQLALVCLLFDSTVRLPKSTKKNAHPRYNVGSTRDLASERAETNCSRSQKPLAKGSTLCAAAPWYPEFRGD